MSPASSPSLARMRPRNASDPEDSIDSHLQSIQLSVSHLRSRVRELEAANALLSAHNAPVPSTSHNSALSMQVKQLRQENHRQKRRIDKLEKQQLEHEVDDLKMSPSKKGKRREVSIELDETHRMRKLLRSFNNLMNATTLTDNGSDYCPKCLRVFTVKPIKNCSVLNCRHMLCHECIPSQFKGADETVKCFICSECSPRDNLEIVQKTETERWDALLDVALAFAAIDRMGEEETSDEDESEHFIDDGHGTSEVSSVQDESEITAQETEDEAEDCETPPQPSTPPPRLSFSQSPTKEKRKRMEQLAEARANKKRK